MWVVRAQSPSPCVGTEERSSQCEATWSGGECGQAGLGGIGQVAGVPREVKEAPFVFMGRSRGWNPAFCGELDFEKAVLSSLLFLKSDLGPASTHLDPAVRKAHRAGEGLASRREVSRQGSCLGPLGKRHRIWTIQEWHSAVSSCLSFLPLPKGHPQGYLIVFAATFTSPLELNVQSMQTLSHCRSFSPPSLSFLLTTRELLYLSCLPCDTLSVPGLCSC